MMVCLIMLFDLSARPSCLLYILVMWNCFWFDFRYSRIMKYAKKKYRYVVDWNMPIRVISNGYTKWFMCVYYCREKNLIHIHPDWLILEIYTTYTCNVLYPFDVIIDDKYRKSSFFLNGAFTTRGKTNGVTDWLTQWLNEFDIRRRFTFYRNIQQSLVMYKELR